MTSLMHIGEKLLNLGEYIFLENESTVLSDESKVRLTGLGIPLESVHAFKNEERMPGGAIKRADRKSGSGSISGSSRT